MPQPCMLLISWEVKPKVDSVLFLFMIWIWSCFSPFNRPLYRWQKHMKKKRINQIKIKGILQSLVPYEHPVTGTLKIRLWLSWGSMKLLIRHFLALGVVTGILKIHWIRDMKMKNAGKIMTNINNQHRAFYKKNRVC